MKRILFGLILIFVLGNVSGAFIGARFQEERHEKRDKVDNLKVNLLDLLERKLSLTPDQTEEIEPLIGEACGKIRKVYQRGTDDIEQIVRQYHDRIALKLTPGQDVIFKKLEAERRRENESIDNLNLGDGS
ncbi:MAG: hypothetical protein KDN22_25070 [Verrucomicrobiae bacterium]|nr:hypothetical protein [Verrucomicrobiae bacterium]